MAAFYFFYDLLTGQFVKDKYLEKFDLISKMIYICIIIEIKLNELFRVQKTLL